MSKQHEWIKPNRFQQVLSEGKIPVGHMLFEFNTRGVAQLLDAAGLDFVVIDMEHSSFSMGQTADLIGWLKATTVAPFVRIPQVQYHHIARAMDAGALGVAAPNVNRMLILSCRAAIHSPPKKLMRMLATRISDWKPADQ